MNAQGFTAEGLTLAATIILLFPMLYFLFVSFTFFLRPLADPIVGRMMRGLFNAYFLGVAACGILAIAAFMGAHQSKVAASLALLAACALAARAWMVPRMDAVLRAPSAGTPTALRRFQLAAMAYNAIQLSILLASVPRLFPMR